MRVSNSQKDQFVIGVMSDVPYTDYPELIRNFIVNCAVSRLPTSVLELWNATDKRSYVMLKHSHLNHCGYVYYPGNEEIKLKEEEREEISKFQELAAQQIKKRSELQSKLNAIISTCSTRAKAEALLPEFVKYLPDEAAQATKDLPMTTDLVVSLTAAGWLKDNKNPALIAT